MERLISLSVIEPHDENHPKIKESWNPDSYREHENGIEYVVEQIKAGREILPIIVVERFPGKYLRRDGYKRYMAFARLGRKEIPCLVLTEFEAAQMPQHFKGAFK